MTRSPLLKKVPETGIIATVGPAQLYKEGDDIPAGKKIDDVNLEIIRNMMIEGARNFRINFSHAAADNHHKENEFAWHIRQIAAELGIEHEISIVADLQGPKHRLGEFKPEEGQEQKDAKAHFAKDDTLIMHSNIPEGYVEEEGEERIVHVHFEDKDIHDEELHNGDQGIYASLKPGQKVLMADGKVKVEILEVGEDENGKFAKTRVIKGQKLSRRKGVNFPGTALNISTLTPKDINDLKASIRIGADKIALSFVQTAEDVRQLRKIIEELRQEIIGNESPEDYNPIICDPNYKPEIIAKIEKPMALLHIDEIAAEADELMFARGDMGVEIPYKLLPTAKELVKAAAKVHNIPLIIATQVAPSLEYDEEPNRTEVCAIHLYADEAQFLMLSEESAMGVDPANAIKQLRICIEQAKLPPEMAIEDLVEQITPDFNEEAKTRYKQQAYDLMQKSIDMDLEKALYPEDIPEGNILRRASEEYAAFSSHETIVASSGWEPHIITI